LSTFVPEIRSGAGRQFELDFCELAFDVCGKFQSLLALGFKPLSLFGHFLHIKGCCIDNGDTPGVPRNYNLSRVTSIDTRQFYFYQEPMNGAAIDRLCTASLAS
jgi:hypothetical protein